MSEHDWLAEQFAANRSHLLAVAYRMLGSLNEAEDAVQETWLRLSRSDTAEVENLGGWLTTVVARVCLNLLRSRQSRPEESLDADPAEPIGSGEAGIDPEREALLADSIGPALLIVLETLAPVERVAFVLHDVFGVPFEEIAPIVGRAPGAARQLASRARRRVRGATLDHDADTARQRQVVEAFRAAAWEGNFAGLLALLDPEVILRADPTVTSKYAPGELRGATAVAQQFAGRAQGARLALVNGFPGLVWTPGGRPRIVLDFRIARGKIVEIIPIADPERLGKLDVVVLDRPRAPRVPKGESGEEPKL